MQCEKRLDIEPYSSISSEKALLTESDVMGTLIGCYDGLQRAQLYGGDIMVLNELIGNTEFIRFTGTFPGLSDAYSASMSSNNDFAGGTWVRAYSTINRCNTVISALDKVVSSADNRNKVEGEALFLRASVYFELVRLYAKFYGDGDYSSNPGVPISLKPTVSITDATLVYRNTVKEVYDLVMGDLEKAESLLPSSNQKYATKWAATAQLSRVYLMLGRYADAAAAADRVIRGSGKTLNPNFKDLWFTYINFGGVTPAEYIFYIKLTTQDGVNSMNTYFGRTIASIPGTGGRSDCKIRDNHIALYENGDTRKTFFVTSGGNKYTQKHLDPYGDVPVIRLAEMYLTRAEANFRSGSSVGASPLQDVNTIRNRAGLTPLSTVTLDDILRERSLELAFEGHSLIESKRLKKSVGSLPWNSPKLIMPIPQREMDVNKNLVQNEGY
jgi:tetratricopeptide (TPR) repeat protein